MGIPSLNWEAATSFLSQRDPVMAALVARFGSERLVSRGEPFTCLVRSIVGQQISVKAADSVWHRLASLVLNHPQDALAPHHLLAQETNLRSAGLSARKVDYLLHLARWFADDPELSDRLHALPDQEVLGLLTRQPGIGPWTAQMFLIFTLMRPDVFPADDLGVLKAIEQHYGDELTGRPRGSRRDQLVGDALPQTLPARKKAALAFSARWAPHRTVATWLLWRSLDPIPVTY